MRKAFVVLVAVALAVALAACGKSKEKGQEEQQKAREWEVSNFTEGKTPPPKPKALPKDQVVEVPAAVKKAYSTVKMGVGDYKTKQITEFNVKIGGSAEVPGTGYTIKIHSYLPHWVLRGNVVTSKGDKPDDPAVRATITEGENTVFDGYIFQRHKTPSFRTDTHVIGLLGAS